jgi:hypothetical protein
VRATCFFAELFKRGNCGVALRDINGTKYRRMRRPRIRARKMKTKRLINDPQNRLLKIDFTVATRLQLQAQKH